MRDGPVTEITVDVTEIHHIILCEEERSINPKIPIAEKSKWLVEPVRD
jgi:hypothetical protein